MMAATMAGFVLCGGRSRRMGEDKALLHWGGHTLLEHVAETVLRAAGSVTLVGAPERYAHLPYRTLADSDADAGPLAGLVTLLSNTTADWNLVVAVDMPEVAFGFVSELLAATQGDESFDAVIPVTTGGQHPLCAVYHKHAEVGLRQAFRNGERKVREAIKCLKIKEINVRPELVANLNTREDWVRFVNRAHA
jgi:molybdenum cofactor guanylyltransferase